MFLELFIHTNIVSVFLVTFLIGLLLYHNVTRPPGLPPGPPLLPVIGNLYLRLWKDGKFLYPILRKKYGDIFSLYYGRMLFVVLSTVDLAREAYVDNAETMSDKPLIPARLVNGKAVGILASSGTIWKQQRKFALSVLRSFGFGKRNIEDRILEEIQFLMKHFKSKNSQPFNPKSVLVPSVSNVINSIVFGRRFEYEDKDMAEVLKLLIEPAAPSRSFVLFSAFPFLRHLPGDIFGIQGIRKNREDRRAFIRTMYTQHLETYQDGVVRDFVDAYIERMKHEANLGDEESFTEDQLIGVVQDLFEAGTDTTATTLRWALVYLLRNPDVQTKLQTEIDNVVGKDRLPSLSDKDNMPYTEAVIAEVLRISVLLPSSVPHSNRETISFRGYRIPIGARIIVDMTRILKSELFGDPDVFRPERFLDENGRFVNMDDVIPFSLGRRVCLGKSLAKSELFLFLTSMLQQFSFIVPEGEPLPETDGTSGFFHKPYNFTVKAIPR